LDFELSIIAEEIPMKKILCIVLGVILLVGLTGCANNEQGKHDHVFSSETISPTCTQEGFTIYTCSSCGFKMRSDFVPALTVGGHNYINCVCKECGDFLADEAVDTESLQYVKTTDENNNEIYVVTGIAEEAEYIKIPSTHNGIPVTRIGDKAFENLLTLKHVIIPDSVISIGNSAFKYCFNLKSIAIPESVNAIGEEAFWDCQNLNSFSIPNLSIIKNYTFIGCESITDIEIPKGVTALGVHSFGDCYNLTSITIPVSVKQISHASFWRCRSLQNIFYEGTKQQWNDIHKEVGEYTDTKEDASWDAYTGAYTIHCSDGLIEKN